MATCVVSGTFLDPSETAISGATVYFELQSPVSNAANATVMPLQTSTTTAADGTWSLTLSQGLSGDVTLACPQNSISGTNLYRFAIMVPSAPTATFASCWAGSLAG